MARLIFLELVLRLRFRLPKWGFLAILRFLLVLLPLGRFLLLILGLLETIRLGLVLSLLLLAILRLLLLTVLRLFLAILGFLEL